MRAIMPLGLAVTVALINCGHKKNDLREFTADLIDHKDDRDITGKFYIKGASYRMDREIDCEQTIMIVSQETGLTRVIYPESRDYYVIPSINRMNMKNDLFQYARLIASKGESRSEGVSPVSGYECEISILSMEGEELVARWMPTDLGFPLRIDMLVTEDRYVELRNIKVTAVDDSLFLVPHDYSPMSYPDQPRIGIPDWADSIPSAPIITPPFRTKALNGEIIRVKTEPGKSFMFRATDITGDSSFARDIPFRAGKPLKNVSSYDNFARKGILYSRHPESITEADEIVIHVEKGGFTLEAEVNKAEEKDISEGEDFRVSLYPENEIEVRFTNIRDSKAECKFMFMYKGRDISVGADEHRTITMTSINENNSKTLRHDKADELLFRVIRGTMHIKVTQYEKTNGRLTRDAHRK